MPKPKQQKRDEALVRQAEYDKLSLDRKLSQCHMRRGTSKREAMRLMKQMREAQNGK